MGGRLTFGLCTANGQTRPQPSGASWPSALTREGPALLAEGKRSGSPGCVIAYVAEHPNAVVIFASPETCFSCQGPLLRILQQRAAPHKATALYLTNPPDRPMRNLLVQYRLDETGILRVPPRVRTKQLTVVQLRAGKQTRSWANPTAEKLLRVVASTGSDVEGR